MDPTKKREYFRSLMNKNKCYHPGSVFDPISARIAEDIGFEIGMFAGSIASMTVLGAPDLIVLTLSEFCEQAHRVCRASGLALLVDADHGYGNALSVKRTVEELETAGVSALTIEDTRLPKTYSNEKTTALLSLEEGVGKMKAALEGRSDNSLIITARTSAFRVTNDEDALVRAKAYEAAGVDALFFAGISTRAQIELLNASISIPIFIAPKGNEVMDLTYLADKGVKICLQSHQPFSASVQAIYTTLKALREGTTPSNIKSIASNELMKEVTRSEEYERLTKDYL
jgi:carboxyvinyl-carboxyphosphonate phosphorylmutase